MTDVLVIWNTVPEDCAPYLLQLEGEELERVLRCAGHYINTVEAEEAGLEEDLNWLSERLRGMEPASPEDKPLKIESETLVIITGFLL